MVLTNNKDANQISQIANSTLYNPNNVGTALAHDHPFLQQQHMKMMIGFIREASKKSYDGRNEYTVKLCRELIKTIDNFQYNSNFD